MLYMYTKVPTWFSQSEARAVVFNSFSFVYLLGEGDQEWGPRHVGGKEAGPGPWCILAGSSVACWGYRLCRVRIGGVTVHASHSGNSEVSLVANF